jgi:hypothetical protein
MNRFVCLHGHFSQPPRENPWLEEVEFQDSAAPYHDWNERVTADCYAANAASRLMDGATILRIVNNYEKISFSVSPALFAWFRRHRPDVATAIVKADRLSCERHDGQGSAMAQPYSQMVLPLATARDRQTAIRWGIDEFRQTFDRRPEGFWLTEWAVDEDTLEAVAAAGISFIVLHADQALALRPPGSQEWQAISGTELDFRLPYLCPLPSGRTLAIFFSPPALTREIGSGDILRRGDTFAQRLVSLFRPDDAPQLVHAATNGETYGHHHRFGDMALAACLNHLEANRQAEFCPYAAFLQRFPPTIEVRIRPNSSASCPHDLGRWRGSTACDCGRDTGRERPLGEGPEPALSWRAPWRGALDWLRDNLATLFQDMAASLLTDPWGARDDFGEILAGRNGLRHAAHDEKAILAFLERWQTHPLTEAERISVLQLLEMQKQALLMAPAGAWNVTELSSLEPIQAMLTARRAMHLASQLTGLDLAPVFRELLERAPSTVARFGNGRRIFEAFVDPAVVDLFRVASHFAVLTLFGIPIRDDLIYTYRATQEAGAQWTLGRQRLVIGQVHIRSQTTWEEARLTYAFFHLGDHNLVGGVRSYLGEEGYARLLHEAAGAFNRSDTARVIRLIDEHFSEHRYTLWHLFRDDQRDILHRLLEGTQHRMQASFQEIYQEISPVMSIMTEIRMPLPPSFRAVLGLVLERQLRDALLTEPLDLPMLDRVISEIERWQAPIDRPDLGFLLQNRLCLLTERLQGAPEDLDTLETIVGYCETLERLALEIQTWQTQNQVYELHEQRRPQFVARAAAGDPTAQTWLRQFERLGRFLRLKVS